MPKPIDGRIDASRQLKGDQYQTIALISSLRHEFLSFSGKIPCCFRPSMMAVAPSGNEFSAGSDFADHHLGNAASFMKTKESVHRLLDGLINRMHHGAGCTAR
ncbi:MAG TPA: hypothetical protein VN968_05125 [Bradyrhizobium sp.]|nr:hypothetical protein [Bradyrhizobium sp.]